MSPCLWLEQAQESWGILPVQFAAGTVPNRLNGSRSRAISRKMENGSSGESRIALAGPRLNFLQVEPGSLNCR